MKQYVEWMSRVCDLMAVVAAALLIGATVVICWMVFYRALGYSTSWELELAIFLMVCSLFLASPYTLKTKGHVGGWTCSQPCFPPRRRVCSLALP